MHTPDHYYAERPARSELLAVTSAILKPERLEELYLDLRGMSYMEGGWPELPTLQLEQLPTFSEWRSPHLAGRVTLNIYDATLVLTERGEVTWNNLANDTYVEVSAQADFSGHNHPSLSVSETEHGEGKILSLRNPQACKWLGLLVHDIAILEIITWRWNHRHSIEQLVYDEAAGTWSLLEQPPTDVLK